MAASSQRQHAESSPLDAGALEPARTHGMLLEVNWRERTAQLHPVRPFPGERHVPLCFSPALDAEMRRYATQFVTVAGKARFNENDEYEVFHVEEIIPDRGNGPFSQEELEETLAKAKPFVPGEVPPMDLSEEEVLEFIRVIHQARDV